MRGRIVIAPFANSRTREWPADYFRQLAALCLDRLDGAVHFIGAKAQRHSVNAIIRALPADRCLNHCGLLSWEQTGALVRTAACVVANNSGVGHLAAALGIPVVSVFAGTHSPLEWMPRGPYVSVVVRKTRCSACGIDISPADCPHNLRCLRDIDPAAVFAEVCRRIVGRDPFLDAAEAGQIASAP